MDAGLQPAFRHVIGPDDESRDTVVAQNPAEGTQVDAGTTVLAEINVGPATTEIPDDLVGRDLDKALEELADAGFVNVSAVPVADPPADADDEEVLAVEPGEGELAALEQDIVVRYAGVPGSRPPSRPTMRPRSRQATGNESEATDEPTSDNEGSNEDNEGSNEDNEGSNEDETEEPTEESDVRGAHRRAHDEPTEEQTESASESPAGESSGGASESADDDEPEEPEAGVVGE